MPMSFLFWSGMLLWLVLGSASSLKGGAKGVGTALLPWLCVLLLGWQVLGAPIQ